MVKLEAHLDSYAITNKNQRLYNTGQHRKHNHPDNQCITVFLAGPHILY